MSDPFLLRLGKLSGPGTLLAAARHNKRELQEAAGATTHINAALSSRNYCIAGAETAAEVAAAAKRMKEEAGIAKTRRDAIQAVEILVSLPAGSQIEHASYFTDCTMWAKTRFGVSNLLSSDVHLDEAAPHCHILILPLVDGRMNGSAMVGGIGTLNATIDDFFSSVASRYGLSRGAGLLTPAQKRRLADVVVKRLLSDSDGATASVAWECVRRAILRDPGPFAMALGIPIEPNAGKSFTDIFIGRGRRTSEDKPIDFPRPYVPKPILCRFPPPLGSLDAAQTVGHGTSHERADSSRSNDSSMKSTARLKLA